MENQATEEEIEETPEIGAWSWGAGTDGQLGVGARQDYYLPQPLLHLPPVSHIACGGAHAVALTGDGKVLTWGRGTNGQLGHGDLESCCRPKLVNFFNGLAVSNVSAGWNHSGFVTDTGRLFMCGDGSFGQLGNGDYQSHRYPFEVVPFSSQHVKQVACGMRHSIALVTRTSGCSIYAFGSGRHGQLGCYLSGAQRSLNLPEPIEELHNCELVSIHANGDHSAALSANGQLYIWGRRFSGSSDYHIPQLVPSSLRFSQIALGWNHAITIADGEVYMIGGRHHGMLSDSKEVNITGQKIIDSNEAPVSLERVTFSGKQAVVSIATGSEHSVLMTEEGTIMTWGWGEHGQLGLGDTLDQTCPQTVNVGCNNVLPSDKLAIYCGSGFTIVARLAK